MNASLSSVPVVLTIAGSDCCGGAGIQADLKVFTAHQVHGLTAVTCVVSEVPGRVSLIHPVPPAVVADQIRLLLDTYPVAVVKTGMLYSEEIIELTAAALESMAPPQRPLLVVDPVMIASSGDALITRSAVAAYQKRLFGLATLITPNLDEGSVLLGRPLREVAELGPAAAELRARYGAAVLLKGGHLATAAATDVLQDGEGELVLTAPFLRGAASHGTGCTYASAIAAQLARGQGLRASCRAAKRYINLSIRDSLGWGQGGAQVLALRQWRHRGQR